MDDPNTLMPVTWPSTVTNRLLIAAAASLGLVTTTGVGKGALPVQVTYVATSEHKMILPGASRVQHHSFIHRNVNAADHVDK